MTRLDDPALAAAIAGLVDRRIEDTLRLRAQREEIGLVAEVDAASRTATVLIKGRVVPQVAIGDRIPYVDERVLVRTNPDTGIRYLAAILSRWIDEPTGTAAEDDFIQRKSGVWVNRTPAQVLVDLAHGPGTHNNLVRRFTLLAHAAGLDGGALVVVGTVPNAVEAVALADGATQGCYWHFPIPSDFDPSGTFSVRPFWVPGATDAAAHSVRWSMVTRVLNSGASFAGAGTTVAWTGQSVAHTVNILVQSGETFTDTTLSPANHEQSVLLNFRRVGADAADTYVGTVNLLGVQVAYVANQ